MRDGESKKVWLKGVPFEVVLVKKVFTNEDGSIGILYLASNDIEQDAAYLYQIYQKRWKIEEYHKSIKENAMGFVKSMELLTNFDNPDGKRMVFIFYKEMNK